MGDSIRHFGILGMKWGRRKAREISAEDKRVRLAREEVRKEELLRAAIKEGRIRPKGVKKLSEKDFSKLANSPEMANKLRKYESEVQKRRIANAAIITAATLIMAAPAIYEIGTKVYRFAGAKKYYDTFNKYGGHDPNSVINSKFKKSAATKAAGVVSKALTIYGNR